MNKIEPNSDEDLIDHYLSVNLEYVEFSRSGYQRYSFEEARSIFEGYRNMIRLLEKHLLERRLYH